jgi:hypothetical protein
MSVDFASMHARLFDTFAVDGTVVRGASPPVAVKVIIDRSVETLGDYGKVLTTVATASFLTTQWVPKQGDVIHIGSEVKKVDKLHSDDGFVARAVLHA